LPSMTPIRACPLQPHAPQMISVSPDDGFHDEAMEEEQSMRSIRKSLLGLLALLGILVFCFLVAFSYLVFRDTKLLGVVFLGAGLWGTLEMAGVVKVAPSQFRERTFNLVVGAVGSIFLGIYFLLR